MLARSGELIGAPGGQHAKPSNLRVVTTGRGGELYTDALSVSKAVYKFSTAIATSTQ